MAYQYIADVTLPEDVETYVIREADEQLYQKLIEGKFVTFLILVKWENLV